MKPAIIAALILACGSASSVFAYRMWPEADYKKVIAQVDISHPGIHRDPQERDQALKATFQAAEAKAIKGLQNAPPDYPGFILLFWRVKTSILFRDHGLRWKSPAVLNPKIDFTKQQTPNKAVDSTATRVTPPAEQEPRHGQP